MQLDPERLSELLDLLIQVIVIALPVVISWIVRNYLKDTSTEKQIGSIVRLANAAIDYVENLDKRGDLVLPPDVKKGGEKLKLAGQWLEGELQRNGIKVSTKEAMNWIASEYQRRVGEIRSFTSIGDLAEAAVDLLIGMSGEGLSQISLDSERFQQLVEIAADWVVAHLAEERGATFTRQEAVTWVRAALLQRLQANVQPTGGSLRDLARQALAFVQDLQKSGRMSVRPSAPGANVELDIAMGWMLTESARRGLSVTPDEIANAVRLAMQESPG